MNHKIKISIFYLLFCNSINAKNIFFDSCQKYAGFCNEQYSRNKCHATYEPVNTCGGHNCRWNFNQRRCNSTLRSCFNELPAS